MCMFHRLQGRSPVSLTEAQARAFLQVSQTHRPYLPCPFTSGRHPTSHPHVLLDSKAAVVGVVLQEIKCPVLLFMGDKGWPYAPESMAARGACVAQLQVGASTLTRGPLTSHKGAWCTVDLVAWVEACSVAVQGCGSGLTLHADPPPPCLFPLLPLQVKTVSGSHHLHLDASSYPAIVPDLISFLTTPPPNPPSAL